MTYTRSLIAHIRSCREAKGYSQEYMSAVLNICQSTYAHLESGKASLTIDRLFEIVEILEMDIHAVIDTIKASSKSKSASATLIRQTKDEDLLTNEMIKQLRNEINSLKKMVMPHTEESNSTPISHSPQ